MSTIRINFTKGGYQGDVIEETFKPFRVFGTLRGEHLFDAISGHSAVILPKMWRQNAANWTVTPRNPREPPFTVLHMPFWWHFREVLRASDRASQHWKKSDDTPLSDDAQRELVALSLLNYAVYTGIAEAIASFDQIGYELARTMVPTWRLFEVRRLWKALYSSLYTSFNALCNIVCVIVGPRSPFGENPKCIWNYTPKCAYNLVNGRAIKELAGPIDRCKDRLEIRDHLDHYWTIWHTISQGTFLLDENFTKGYVPIHPETEVSTTVDAYQLAREHIVEAAEDFNLIYRESAVKGGYLDQYLSARGWRIDYTDYGPPHNGQRPQP